MNESTKTKKALRGSLFALFLCIVLLIGTTFAWFTDSVSTGVNRIQAGNLDVDFQYWNGDKYVSAENVSLFSEDTLWEPGHTEVVYLKVINKGNLALKYRLNTINTFENSTAQNSAGNTISLSKYLKIGTVEEINASKGGAFADREAALEAAESNLVSYNSYTKENTLLPAKDGNESADYLAFVVTMPSTVGNEANSVNGSAPFIRFNLALNATQVESEYDSFGNDYDKDVEYPIGSSDAGLAGEEIQEQLNAANPYILLGSDAKRPAGYGLHVNSPATINLNGFTLTSGGSQSTLSVIGNGNLTVIGNGTVDASNVTNSSNALSVASGGTATIKGGTFLGKDGNSCIYNAGGTITIEGGTFKIDGDTKWTLNCQDNSDSTITVKGGKFYKFDPSNANTGKGEIVVPDDYKVVHDGDWYTVVKN